MANYVRAGAEFTVNSSYARSQYDGVSARLSSGDVVVVWAESDPGSSANRLFKARVFAPDGTPAGAEFTLVTGAGHSPAVAALADGGFVVSWASGGLYAQRFDADGAARAPAALVMQSTMSAYSQNSPDVAGLPGGGYALVWEDERTSGGDTSRLGVHLRLFDGDGAAVGGDVLVNTATSRNQFDASVTAFADGGYVVTWTDSGAGAPIKAQIFTAAGARVGGEMLVSSSGSVGSSVTLLENGNFAVAWYQSGAHNVQVFTQAGALVGGPVSVLAGLSGTQIGPEIAALAGGGYAIAWTTEGTASPGDGSGRAIAVQVFGADGTADGPPQLVNSQTGGDQIEPDIVAFADGSFLVTWTDINGTGADDDEVKAQRFSTYVEPVNAAPVIVSDGGGTSAALDMFEGATYVTTVAATDADGPEPVRFAIAGGADAALFAIDEVTGVLSFIAAPDFETPADEGEDNFLTVIVSASDGALSTTQSIQVLVADVDEGVRLLSYQGEESVLLSIAENGPAVGQVAAEDGDGEAVVYSIAGGADAALFAMDAGTGALAFLAAPDFEAPADADGDNVYMVEVAATAGASAATQAFAVTVENANEGLAITSGGGGASASVSVAENGRAVAAVVATDVDGTAPAYSIAGGVDAERFTIDAATGLLEFVSAPDYEAPGDGDGDNVYEVVVAAGDGEFSDTQALSVAVTNLRDGSTIAGTEGADIISTTAGPDGQPFATDDEDSIHGNGGADQIFAGSGNDSIDGGAGADEMAGGRGDDVYHVDDAGDRVVEKPGEGSDTVFTRLNALTLAANVENLVFTGKGGFAGTGNALANRIEGGAGFDTLVGGAGADTLIGGASNDTYNVDDAGDLVIELAGGGSDRVFTSLSSYTLPGEVENVQFSGSGSFSGTGNAGNNQLVGAGGSDTLVGGAGFDTLDGRGGADVMAGGAHNDTYYVDHAGDEVVELAGGGADRVYTTLAAWTLGAEVENLNYNGAGAFAGTGNGLGNQIVGGAMGDTLRGEAGNDTLMGNGGGDRLEGGAGADVLVGGAGADVYAYRSAGESTAGARDQIGFAAGDRIDLSLIDAVAGGADDAFHFVGSGAFSGTAGELRASGSGNAWTVEADLDGDTIADLVIAVTSAAPLTGAEFIL